MKKSILLVLAVLSVLSFAACRPGAAPITGGGSSAVASNLGKKVTAADVKQAIYQGCVALNWRPMDASPGVVEATITVRNKHTVVVSIPYTEKGYVINYKSSANMEYNEASGGGSSTIHPSYNKWVANLEKAINQNLVAAGK